MAFSLEALYSFFSPPASRNPSPQGSPSVFTSTFFGKSAATTTQQTDLPMPPSSAAMPSPAESSHSSAAASERDYSPLQSPFPHRRPSMSSTSSNRSSELQQDEDRPSQPHRAATTTLQNDESQDDQLRPAAPRRSATEVGPLEPLSRTFPAPTQEPSLDELLARPPGKWSLNHYVKNARVRGGVEEDPEQRARKFEDIKAQLLKAKGELDGMGKSI